MSRVFWLAKSLMVLLDKPIENTLCYVVVATNNICLPFFRVLISTSSAVEVGAGADAAAQHRGRPAGFGLRIGLKTWKLCLTEPWHRCSRIQSSGGRHPANKKPAAGVLIGSLTNFSRTR